MDVDDKKVKRSPTLRSEHKTIRSFRTRNPVPNARLKTVQPSALRPGHSGTGVKTIISIELIIALIFVIGAEWAGENIHRLFHSYFADFALPFGFYFLLILNEDHFSFLRHWYGKALAVFMFVSASEIMQYFGLYAFAIVFDPIDFVMYLCGVLLAALVDVKIISKYYPGLHITNKI